jgi:hypothetical protein
MLEFLSSLISEEVKKDFEFLAESNPLGFNETLDMYSVPFGQTVIKVFGSSKEAQKT